MLDFHSWFRRFASNAASQHRREANWATIPPRPACLRSLYSVTDATPTVRTFLAGHGDAEKILTTARAHRERIAP